MAGKTKAPYGSWASPLSSKLVAGKQKVFAELRKDKTEYGKDYIYWNELNPSKGGSYLVHSYNTVSGNIKCWTPDGYSARTGVHEYGGGAFLVYNGTVYFSNWSDQRVYIQTSPEGQPLPITPHELQCRYADGEHAYGHIWTKQIVCVRENHTLKDEKSEAENSIVMIDKSCEKQTVLASGADFYSCPRFSPNNQHLCWVQWNHPNMPWDDTELYISDIDLHSATVSNVTLIRQQTVSGGGGEQTADQQSYLQPVWTPDNRLLYICDISGYWQLYLYDPGSKSHRLVPGPGGSGEREIGGPPWQLGYSAYDVNPVLTDDERYTGDVALTYGKRLGIYNLVTESYRELDTGYTSHTCVQWTSSGRIYCVASSSDKFSSIIQVEPETGKVEVISTVCDLVIDPDYISVPSKIKYNTGKDGSHVSYGWFYPPRSGSHCSSEEGDALPPLLVLAHGGPTSQASTSLSLKVQYFTSRGLAVLDVDYRGSTGYGRRYRDSLRGNWGVYDVEDVVSGATHLARTGHVDINKLCISGGSAGGYTVLAALTYHDTFKAGASYYGVSDLSALALETHKFESRYLDSLLGPYPACADLYQARSPIHSVHTLNCPVVFFQGDQDYVVPKNQAEKMNAALKAKGIMTELHLYHGEGHGFRKSENISNSLERELAFYGRVFGFTPQL